jgi:hypothetical protein
MGRLDPIKEAAAAKSLRESLQSLGETDADLLADMVEGETSFMEAVDAILARIDADRALVVGTDKAISDLEARRERFAKRIETSRALLEQAIMVAEIEEKIERPTATIFLTRRPAKVEITDEAAIPSQFWKAAAPALDKKAVAAALKGGEAVPGATLNNQAPTLTIRTA